MVSRARRGGRKVILGGHWLGPGWRSPSGLGLQRPPGPPRSVREVVIDGGLLGTLTRRASTVCAPARGAAQGDPFLDLLRIHVPWASGVFSGVARLYGRGRPTRARRSDFPAIPAALHRSFPVTNEGGLGYAFDHLDLPGRAVADPRARRRARGERRPAAVAERRGDADPERRAGSAARRSTRPSGTSRTGCRSTPRPQHPGRNAVIKRPGPACGTSARSHVPLFAIQTDRSRAGGRVARGGWSRRRGSRRGA